MTKFSKAIMASIFPLVVSLPAGAQTKTAVDFINLFETLNGKQPGMRKAHAKGLCASAEFKPNRALAQYSTSPLFSHESINANLRFSMGGGNPSADERSPGARGMAIQLNLPNGIKHNIVGNSAPFFAAKDPETFFGLLSTFVPDAEGKVDRSLVAKYIAEHESTQPAAEWQKTAKTPYSYANTRFFGLHTFFMVDENSNETKFRWHITPSLGEKVIDKEDIAQYDSEFLEDHLRSQMESGSISFSIAFTIGTPQDTNIDPTQAWPTDREVKSFGELTLTNVGDQDCININFDPNVLSAGFKSSKDPILLMRSPAYAVSFAKRLSGQ